MRLLLENTLIRLSILSFILFKYSNKFLFGFDWRWWVCCESGQWWTVTKQQRGVNVFFLLMSVNLGIQLRGCFNWLSFGFGSGFRFKRLIYFVMVLDCLFCGLGLNLQMNLIYCVFLLIQWKRVFIVGFIQAFFFFWFTKKVLLHIYIFLIQVKETEKRERERES